VQAGRAAIAFRRMPSHQRSDAPEYEEPGEDGIRHQLVARVRAEIAAGTYDTEEKWLVAEAALLARVEARE
jgi:hypothetical protein